MPREKVSQDPLVHDHAVALLTALQNFVTGDLDEDDYEQAYDAACAALVSFREDDRERQRAVRPNLRGKGRPKR